MLFDRIRSPFALALILSAGCCMTYPKRDRVTDYDLSQPDNSLILPDTLREISGITDIDSVTIACIQDENGIVFIYNLLENRLTGQYPFSLDGDYEGITRVGNTMYILRSDGVLLEITDHDRSDFNVITYLTNIPANDNEGLCYDPFGNRLLIASKGKIGKGPEFKNKRVIYEFDLRSKKLTEEPVFDLDLELIKAFAIENNISLPTKALKKKGETVTEPFIKFMTSAIAVHTASKKLYLLSASDHLFFVFSMSGEIEHIEPLNPELFNKAEGITFLKNHDMIITNEGEDGKATLLKFNYRK
ncbi:MAG: hypothetical protein WAR83_03600 [Flavobacteriales bacterium]